MKRLLEQDAQILGRVAEAVEYELTKGKATKASIVKSLADQDYCSPSSSGTEKTLMKALANAQVSLTPYPTLCRVMGVAAPNSTAVATRPAQQVNLRQEESTMVNLRSFSAIEGSGEQFKAYFPDGTTKPVGASAVRELESSCTLTEFSL